MSTPPTVPAPPAVPLPPPIEPSSKGGCWKTGVIGCGGAAVVVVLLLIAALLYVRRRPEVMFDMMMTAIESNFAEDVTEEDKRELREAYAEFRTAMRQRRVDEDRLARLGQTFRMRAGQPVRREQVLRLTEAFRAAARSAPSSSPPAPAPTLAPVPGT